jgi:hypothetical protein
LAFKIFDLNGNAEINYDEFLLGLSSLLPIVKDCSKFGSLLVLRANGIVKDISQMAHKDYVLTGLAQKWFGTRGTKSINYQQFLDFMTQLQRDIGKLKVLLTYLIVALPLTKRYSSSMPNLGVKTGWEAMRSRWLSQVTTAFGSF